ncbi:MAG: toll/interleukin-1 receptor domain-containing protein [Nitrospirae bacterium]|uniref:toll/interleukin-1 receptor domain-containing protein n=1 Tax=Candidatus Magnetobacterium casense TaxID=1455061 RepID=UPI00058CCDE5|nr:toll/interleukin-1 receptor domain-containing protein [Candidatus Magnetobacterium casensis]MBF0336499.1 toll/interleukin-1 receptor domain-containing protein [Nitrospirota bacterium]
MKEQIFISSAMQDSEWVSLFFDELRQTGVTVWFFTKDKNIVQGSSIVDLMEKALRESNVMVVIISKNSITSQWVFFEIGVAIADEKRIIPVVIDDVPYESFPVRLKAAACFHEKSPSKAAIKVASFLKSESKTGHHKQLIH